MQQFRVFFTLIVKGAKQMENNTHALVRRSQENDAAAFAELYEMFNRDLYRFAFYMLGNREDALDAVQDAVLQAYLKIATLKNPDAFKSWLFKILSNVCKQNLIKHAQNGQSLDLEDFKNLIPDDNSSQFVMSLELREAIFGLNEEERDIVLLSVIGNYKSQEIAKMLDSRPGTIRSKLARSLIKLKTTIDKNE